ncbi:hypothetical protein [Streptomyces sp. HNM0645]|uniref:hypothetical protein n=1 Tax=Streptomyces sp. HNM0645 TaxID=2782343 RepID=UPI0032D58033
MKAPGPGRRTPPGPRTRRSATTSAEADPPCPEPCSPASPAPPTRGGTLRRFLALDAVVTGLNGAAHLAAPDPLGRLLGIDGSLLAELGALLVAVAAGIGFLASRPEPPAAAVKLVVDVNAAWALLSLGAVVLWLEPTTAGAV